MFVLDHATSARYRPDGQPSWTWASLPSQASRNRLKHCHYFHNNDELADGGASSGPLPCEPYANQPRNRHRGPTPTEIWISRHRLESEPDIFNHNVKPSNACKAVRVQPLPTLLVLEHAAKGGFVTVSGIAGPRETEKEITQTLQDMRSHSVRIVTLGQYLASSKHRVVAVTPEEFERWKQFGLAIGFDFVESGPLVRSSYHADEQSSAFTGIDELKKSSA